MERTAKLFKKGRNQAVVLPAEFAFETESVYIRRDDEGNVVLTARSEKERHRDNFLRMLRQTHVPDTFLSKEERNQSYTTRNPLEGL
ncbi:AbrB/MazE/SpoVT family DNA-binding domain-containing protein [Enterobacter hormaechei]|uniref:AbrB/MazE/SpoVT family DNA-binding domain-containing protein n=1 Tax=Enterobacter hormaechei TaxID=158836 RepID=A0AAX3Z2H3_9ENTR|nr:MULTISPECIES: AbrB/MazE/SpoVT family DNA-binding domain-containing protein [Enterobacter cloacae complex]UAS94652.1 AbrB/MazE/SpoVT family DNA-binding domain-containing protein [Enterobacter cloacae complex sp.]EGK57158.1 virulence-associated protein [Enterobacter hormaechei ATCC 49162]EGQ5286784.1 AbrB/MazE/SpoVT family DNA-binding domain-containing protein [Enterobacter hormaechei]EGQ5311056.1 AbrB/MazE/SpoVT family DNA-binding domain-containing protein [Enterobacter hormaechei]EGQ5314883